MFSAKRDMMDFLIRRSFATKTAILIIGIILVLIGTEARSENVYIGYSLVAGGLLMDWLIIYLVYVEITQIQEEVKQTKVEIEETRSEIEETWYEIEEAKDLAENAKGWD